MKAAYITKKIYMVFLLAVLFSAGCGPSGQSEPDPIGIKIKSPKFDEIAGIYTDVTPSLKFTSSSGGVTECNVFIGTDTKVKGTCGDMPFGTYAYNLEYKYQDLTIAKSIGSITIDENNTETPITLLDKNIDEDNDGCSNLQEVIVGSNPLVQDTCIPPPADLTAKSISTTRIDITWTESSGAIGYKIFRREGSDGADTEIGTSTQTSYSDTGLNADTTYCYKVSAIGNGVESIPTDIVCAKTENGLVAFYPFNGNANDESGNGNDGTVNGATLTNDRFGNADSAYSFDGIDDYIDIGNNVKPNFPITVSTWVNIHTLQDGSGLIRNDQWNPTSYYHGFYFAVTAEGTVGCGVGSGFASSLTRKQYGTTLSLITENTWYHLVAVFNTYNDMHIYVDGVEADGLYGGDGTTMTYSSANGVVGQRWSDKTNGEIDDIRIYNRALTDAEVLTLYNEGQ